MNEEKGLKEVARLFLKLGTIAFGGPAAHIAMMEEEVVGKRQWMSREHFLDLVGATNLIPGPNSTEMTMHCGYERAGYPGLFTAGICFIMPAAVITGVFAWFYAEYGNLPQIEPFLYGIKPAVIAIILNALYKLEKKALKGWQLGVIGLLVVAASFWGISEIMAVLGAGLAGLLLVAIRNREKDFRSVAFLPLLLLSAGSKAVTIPKLFWVFFKVGAVLFGSGYVLVAYLQDELVDKLGWLTQPQLLDAIAIGQFTPGPVLSTATFIGYQIGGWTGAMTATVGIFLPSFFLVMLLNPLVPRMRNSKLLAGFLDGVNIGAVGVMLAVSVQLGAEVLTDWKSWLIALISAVIVFGFKKVNAFWIVIGGALAGFILQTVFP